MSSSAVTRLPKTVTRSLAASSTGAPGTGRLSLKASVSGSCALPALVSSSVALSISVIAASLPGAMSPAVISTAKHNCDTGAMHNAQNF